MLRYGDQRVINRKKVHRIVKAHGWQVTQRQATPRPRVVKRQSVASRSNERWALDATHIDCGADGWGHLVAVIDCFDREIVGYEFALRGRANEAERALEMACLTRFGTLRPQGDVPVVRSDNGLIFQSRRFRAACAFYRLPQEFITPYTPQQNGMIERWFRSLKEECVWQTQFADFGEAQRAIRRWITWSQRGTPPPSAGLPKSTPGGTPGRTSRLPLLIRPGSLKGRSMASPNDGRVVLLVLPAGPLRDALEQRIAANAGWGEVDACLFLTTTQEAVAALTTTPVSCVVTTHELAVGKAGDMGLIAQLSPGMPSVTLIRPGDGYPSYLYEPGSLHIWMTLPCDLDELAARITRVSARAREGRS